VDCNSSFTFNFLSFYETFLWLFFLLNHCFFFATLVSWVWLDCCNHARSIVGWQPFKTRVLGLSTISDPNALGLIKTSDPSVLVWQPCLSMATIFGSGIVARLASGFGNNARPMCIGQKIKKFSKARMDCKIKHCLLQPWIFIHMQQNLTANSFFCAIYFINLFYLKRKECKKKKFISKWFISSL